MQEDNKIVVATTSVVGVVAQQQDLNEIVAEDGVEKKASTVDKNHEVKKIVKLRKSASMKLKRSWFPAFRIGGGGGQSHHVTQPPQQPPQPTLTKTSSLVRRSSSRLNVASDVALNPSAEDYGCTTTPILLSVRKRSTSDSGYSGEDSCDSPIVMPNSTSKKNTSGLSFLRLFHKSSATLQLQHPKAGELNPEKAPYKGHVMTSMDHQRKKKEFLKSRKLPLIPMASSSLSSLNTIQNGNKPLGRLAANNHHHSSSNSVISSSEDSMDSGGRVSSSNYDSGAFSRSSSPTDGAKEISMSMSRLALAEPLVAPRLVLAACRGQWPMTPASEELLSVKMNLIRRKHRARSMSLVRCIDSEDVSVTVGACTKLTIGSPEAANGRMSNLRRSRSGLPVLGTTALRSSPVKPLRSSPIATNASSRNRISTVYLAEENHHQQPVKEQQQQQQHPRPLAKHALVNRSGSIVTVMGSKPSGIKCDCNERVTVNGQHHCTKSIRDLNSKKFVVDRSTNTTPTIHVLNLEHKQPSSIIEI